ncbi:hypothetical protein FSST1_008762 [Fusarium sambucinum]
MHPFRFVHAHYIEENIKYPAQMKIDPGCLNSDRIHVLKSLGPDIPADHLILVLPHSMPVTQLIWPKATRAAQKGSEGLYALLLLNHIKLCGLTSYHFRHDWLQHISMPGCFANALVRSFISSQTYAPVIPTSTFWASDIRGALVSISGAHQFVGPFFKDLKLVFKPEHFHNRPGSIAEALGEYCDPDVSQEDFLCQNNERQCMRLNLARALKVSLKNLRFEKESGLITWDGMQSEVVLAAGKGPKS